MTDCENSEFQTSKIFDIWNSYIFYFFLENLSDYSQNFLVLGENVLFFGTPGYI